MEKGRIINEHDDIKELLQRCQTIAVVGLSPKPDRDSYMVAYHMKKHGYTIIPVRPGQKELLGEPAFGSLNDIDKEVDLINVFRRSELVLAHAKEALRLNPKVFWMQLGVVNQEAADLLIQNGIDVVMDKCIKVEHERYIRKKA